MRAPMRSFTATYCRRARLTHLERKVIDAVGSQLAATALTIWNQQVQAIYKVQRLPYGVEVDFYMREELGKPPTPLPRFRHREEFMVATVAIDVTGAGPPLHASVWCVSGRLFSIEYKGSVRYLDEALGMDPAREIHVIASLTDVALAALAE